ncbi:Uncharacterised protein [Dorea longicatena]|nr:Uncharacterised protein [Dorea longicatena]
MAKKVGQLHTEVFNAYQELLQGGEAQLLMKMKSFWEYLLPDGDRKARKTIHKTSKLANYQSAVSNVFTQNMGMYYPKTSPCFIAQHPDVMG